MSRRSFVRNLNGELSNSWRDVYKEASVMNATTAVFGCTGFVGRHVSAVCSYHKFTNILPFRWRGGVDGGVRAMKHINDGTFGQNFAVDYELDKEFVVKHILEKVDSVYNCVGAWQEPAVYQHSSSWYSMESINVEWPRMLARWSRELGIERFIHMSMVGADLNSPSKVLRQKAMSEIAVLEEFPRATIIRSTDMFAEDDWTYTRWLRAHWVMKVFPLINQGLRIHQPVFVGDIAEAAARAIKIDYTQGRIIELGGPVRFTTVDLLRWIAAVEGIPHKCVSVPKPLMKAFGIVNEKWPFRKGLLIGPRPPHMNQDWVERQCLDNIACPERDPELLDWEDLGIAREDLYRLEDKFFLASIIWSHNHTFPEMGWTL